MKTKGIVAALVFLVLTAAWWIAQRPGRPSVGRPSIIYVVADALRADHLGIYGYERKVSPFLDALGRSGTVFQTVRSTAAWTLPAMVSQFTSQSPVRFYELGRPIPDELNFITEILQGNGYHTCGVSANPLLRQHNNFPQGFDHFHYVNSLDGWYLTRHFEDHVLTKLRKPFFLWLHYMDTHTPYGAPDRFIDTINPNLKGATVHIENARVSSLNREQVSRAIDLYDAEIRYWDYLLQRLYEMLGDDPSILWVITSDHGEALGDHGGTGHGISVYEEQLRVPLILYGRRLARKPEVVSEPVTALDIAPTLLAVAGIETGEFDFEGRNAFSETSAPFRAYALSNWGIQPFTAVYEGDWKYIHDHRDGRHQLFHLGRDPREKRDLDNEFPDVAASLEKRLARYVAANQGMFDAATTVAPEIDAETRDKLKALGYVK
ncbi:MAG: sulfatase [Acidobacteriota bacterium]